MMKKYLGWDCAYKSIAWSHISVNTGIYALISEYADKILAEEGITHADLKTRQGIRRAITVHGEGIVLKDSLIKTLMIFNMKLKGFLQFHHIGAEDILNGKKVNETSEIERTHLLYQFLRDSHVAADKIKDTKTIIEHQPPRLGFGADAKTNNKSTAVSYQLAFHYIEHDPVFIDPKLKNNISLRDDLTYEIFYEKMKQRYKNTKDAKYHARKEHSRANFLYLLEIFGYGHIVLNIPTSMFDDAADSLMQIFSYILKEHEFVSV